LRDLRSGFGCSPKDKALSTFPSRKTAIHVGHLLLSVAERITKGSAQVRFLSLPTEGVATVAERRGSQFDFIHMVLHFLWCRSKERTVSITANVTIQFGTKQTKKHKKPNERKARANRARTTRTLESEDLTHIPVLYGNDQKCPGRPRTNLFLLNR
jgi:hypothetical protein